jgi:hypothetical protein
MSTNVKLVVFVPTSHADIVRDAMGKAGAGKIGKYTYCSFSSPGVGRFLGDMTSSPAVGEAGKYEAVEEERIEVVVPKINVREVIAKMKAVHPYEEVAYDIYPLEDIQ